MGDGILYVTGEQMTVTGETTCVPLGRVGGGKSERAFCGIAHLSAAQRLLVPSAPPPAGFYHCSHMRATLCGLTQYRFLCLFGEKDAIEWQAIRNTVRTGALAEADN